MSVVFIDKGNLIEVKEESDVLLLKEGIVGSFTKGALMLGVAALHALATVGEALAPEARRGDWSGKTGGLFNSLKSAIAKMDPKKKERANEVNKLISRMQELKALDDGVVTAKTILDVMGKNKELSENEREYIVPSEMYYNLLEQYKKSLQSANPKDERTKDRIEAARGTYENAPSAESTKRKLTALQKDDYPPVEAMFEWFGEKNIPEEAQEVLDGFSPDDLISQDRIKELASKVKTSLTKQQNELKKEFNNLLAQVNLSDPEEAKKLFSSEITQLMDASFKKELEKNVESALKGEDTNMDEAVAMALACVRASFLLTGDKGLAGATDKKKVTSIEKEYAGTNMATWMEKWKTFRTSDEGQKFIRDLGYAADTVKRQNESLLKVAAAFEDGSADRHTVARLKELREAITKSIKAVGALDVDKYQSPRAGAYMEFYQDVQSRAAYTQFLDDEKYVEMMDGFMGR